MTLPASAAKPPSARCVDVQFCAFEAITFQSAVKLPPNSAFESTDVMWGCQLARSNPRFIEEHEKPFKLPWFTKIMIAIAVLGFACVGTLLLTAFFSGHLGMMSVTRGDLAKLSAIGGVPGANPLPVSLCDFRC